MDLTLEHRRGLERIKTIEDNAILVRYYERALDKMHEELESLPTSSDFRRAKPSNSSPHGTERKVVCIVDQIQQTERKIKMLRDESEMILARMDDELPTDEATVIRSRLILGLSLRETSEALHMSKTSVHRLFWCGVERLGGVCACDDDKDDHLNG